MPRFKVWCNKHQSWGTTDVSSSVPGNEICPNCGCEKEECNFHIFPIVPSAENVEIECRTGACPSHGC
jgi:hypothetical protein